MMTNQTDPLADLMSETMEIVTEQAEHDKDEISKLGFDGAAEKLKELKR